MRQPFEYHFQSAVNSAKKDELYKESAERLEDMMRSRSRFFSLEQLNLQNDEMLKKHKDWQDSLVPINFSA